VVGMFEGRTQRRRNVGNIGGILDVVVRRVVQATDEPGVVRNVDAAFAQCAAYFLQVRERREQARVGTAAAAAAGAAVMRGFVRVVQARRTVAERDDDRRKLVDEADAAQHAGNALGGLLQREAEVFAAFGALFLVIAQREQFRVGT